MLFWEGPKTDRGFGIWPDIPSVRPSRPPKMFWKLSGRFLDFFRKSSGNVPESFRNVPEMFWNCSGNVLDCFRKPGFVPKSFRRFSGKCPEMFRKYFRKFLTIRFWKFLTIRFWTATLPDHPGRNIMNTFVCSC